MNLAPTVSASSALHDTAPATARDGAASSPRFATGSRGQLGLAGALVAAHAVAVPAGIVGGAIALGVDDPLRGGAASFGIVALVTMLTAGGVVGLGLGRAARTSLRSLGWRAFDAGRDLGLGLAGGVAAISAMVGVAAALGVSSVGETLATVAGYSWVERLVFMSVGLSAAFTEESLFRGYLQPGLVRRLGPIVGIVLGAAIFSAYHLHFSAVALIGKLITGVIFGTMRHRTSSLVPGAIAHVSIWAVLGSA